MIDIENQVYTKVRAAVIAQFSTAYVSSTYVDKPPSFPAVSVEQRDCYPTRATQDTSNVEYTSDVMFEINVYSNKQGTNKSECKAIAAVVDTTLAGIGFTRTMLQPTPNLADATIYRITARYTARVGKDETIYRS